MSEKGASSVTDPSALVGRFKPGEVVPGTPYRVEALVGSGGMGSVYRVEHQELGRRFVLKALHGHLASRRDLQARLRNEWRALGKLEHPNIVQVTDAGQTETGLPYYVMENLRGSTLGQLLLERKKLAPRHACSIAADVLSGLHAAHETGAIHRDIKPPNIFVADDGTTKLLDFGIAKLRDQSAKVVTAGGVSIGTPRYMAPEQASGTEVDGRADIYATALVLYEMVVGKGPFSSIRDANELVMAHIGLEPERADFVDPGVPEELGDLLQRWLSKSPDSRPVSAEFARRELVALAQSLPHDLDPNLEEPTLGGDYDASTVGGPGRLDDLGDQRTPGNSEEREGPRSIPLGGVESSPKTETLTSGEAQTLDAPTERDRDRTQVQVGPAGTLGWGTAQERVSAATRPPRASQEGGKSRETREKGPRRVSITPPPISSLRGQIQGGNRTTIRWIAATACVSFLAALGVTQWISPRPETEEDAPRAEDRPLPPASEAASASAAALEEEPADAPESPPTAEVGEPDETAATPPTPALQEVSAPPSPAQGSPEVHRGPDGSKGTAKKTSRPSTTPAAPSSAGPGSMTPAEKLPESGLW